MKRLVFIALLISFQIALAQPYGQWSQPVNLGPPINTNQREDHASLNMTQDMLVLVTYRPQGDFSGAFLSRLIDGQWSELQYVHPIGAPPGLEPALSPDGNEIYFSCYCGGYGDYDIWKVVYDSILMQWSDPMNLGPNINDSVGQSAPFMFYDGQKLYYIDSSNRFDYPGLVVSRREGDGWSYPQWVSDRFVDADNASLTADGNIIFFDKDVPPRGMLVFFSQKDSAGNWIEPVQFAPINDTQRGFYPRVSPDGNTVYYYAQRDGGYGNMDIWKVERIQDAIEESPSSVPFDMLIYPNPANANFRINLKCATDFSGTLLIADMLGRELANIPIYGPQTVLWPQESNDESQISSGIYFFKMLQGSGAMITTEKATLLK